MGASKSGHQAYPQVGKRNPVSTSRRAPTLFITVHTALDFRQRVRLIAEYFKIFWFSQVTLMFSKSRFMAFLELVLRESGF